MRSVCTNLWPLPNPLPHILRQATASPEHGDSMGYGVDFRQLEALNNLQTAERLEVRTGRGVLHQPQRT